MPLNKPSQTQARGVGQTQAVGFNVGARRTIGLVPEQAWDWVTSPAGVALWLGEVIGGLPQELHAPYRTRDGAKGELRVFEPGSHLRLTWQPSGWERPSLIQVRVLPAGDRTTVAFHQEHLAGPDVRAEMKQRWLGVLAEMQALFGA